MGKKILIVDDSETLRGQLRKDLESSGFSIVEACDGVNGLEVAKSHSDIRLIISDVNMPRMDGITMCSKLSAIDTFKNIPKFMLTTESNPELKIKGKDAGVRGWITKPYVASKLLAAVQKILEG